MSHERLGIAQRPRPVWYREVLRCSGRRTEAEILAIRVYKLALAVLLEPLEQEPDDLVIVARGYHRCLQRRGHVCEQADYVLGRLDTA